MNWFAKHPKGMAYLWAVLLCCLKVGHSIGNPYPNPNAVPKDKIFIPDLTFSPKEVVPEGIPILRVDINWEKGERYQILRTIKESSGTSALLKRATQKNPYGSYQAQLIQRQTGKVLSYDSLGTGKEFRLLTRGMTFRFPFPADKVDFLLSVENPKTGKQEVVLFEKIDSIENNPSSLETKAVFIQAATLQPSLQVSIYAEGYSLSNQQKFYQDAKRVVETLRSNNFPGFSQMEFNAIFSPSQEPLGTAQNLGIPVIVRNSFLGLYFPYWDPFGRWYHVVYPTSEKKYRDGIGTFPYDYPLILIDSSEYWGVGNFNELTAIPSKNNSFTYLLMHEFGHYFGLNEEYEGGGMTELAFAPGIVEPWSQNITFLQDAKNLKWKQFVAENTPLPTPDSFWTGKGPYGAYHGGYGDTEPLGKSYKPAHNCVMKNGTSFCPICQEAIHQKIIFDLGN